MRISDWSSDVCSSDLRELPKFLRGPALAFWVFHVIRDYGWTLRESDSPHAALPPALVALAGRLAQAVGPVEAVFGPNAIGSASCRGRVWECVKIAGVAGA